MFYTIYLAQVALGMVAAGCEIESEFLLLFQSDRQEALEKVYKNRLK
jgi:hypothetical protein